VPSAFFFASRTLPETSATSAVTILTEELPPVKEPTLYKLSFIGAGDNMAYYGNVRDAKKNAEGTNLVCFAAAGEAQHHAQAKQKQFFH